MITYHVVCDNWTSHVICFSKPKLVLMCIKAIMGTVHHCQKQDKDDKHEEAVEMSRCRDLGNDDEVACCAEMSYGAYTVSWQFTPGQ
jgi:hypothetical protein